MYILKRNNTLIFNKTTKITIEYFVTVPIEP